MVHDDIIDPSFARTAWFGDQVPWLSPQPAQPLRELTAAVAAAFPDHPPYAGAFAEPAPHLLAGSQADSSWSTLRQLPLS